MTARFVLTDGTTTINLIRGPYYVSAWRPQTADYKDGGIWYNSPLAEGQQLVDAQFDLTTETITLVLRGINQDEAIRFGQDLRRLLEKASRYWIDPYADEPVWLESKASAETNTRYALVHRGRLVDDGEPFAQPFLQADCTAVMTELSLIVMRGHWLQFKPGSKECAVLTLPVDEVDDAYVDKILATVPFAVWPLNETAGVTADDASPNNFNGTYSGVTLNATTFTNGEPAVQIDDTTGYVNIYNTVMSNEHFDGDNGAALLWFKAPSAGWWTDGNEHYLLSLYGGSSDNILILKNDDNTISLIYTTTATTGTGSARAIISATGLDSLDWLSVIVGWQQLTLVGTTYAIPFMLLNGNFIGAELIPDADFSGILFAARTVIGAQTTAPLFNAGDAYMAYVALWNRPLLWDEMINLAEAPRPTSPPANPDATCTPIAFAANEHRWTKLASIFRFDASLGTYTNLLEQTLPYNVLPSPVAASDIVYFGAAYPFGNLVFDLASGTGYTGHWEYWDGATWATMTALTAPEYIRDNTGGLLLAGVNSVVWAEPTDWATTTVNAVASLYWVRFIVDLVSSPTTAQQQNRTIYSQVLPYIELAEDEIGGDIEALLRLLVRNDWHDSSHNLISSRTGGLVVSRRAVARGPIFSPFINLTDVDTGNPGGKDVFEITAGTDTAFAANTEAPTGRLLSYSGGGSGSAYDTIATITIYSSASQQYLGRFRPYLRTTTTNHSGSHTRVRLKVTAGRTIYSSVFTQGPSVYANGPFALWDFDPVTLGPTPVLRQAETFHKFTIEIQVLELGTAAHTIDLFELILMPLDEWYAEFETATAILSENSYAPGHNQLFVDSITNPKRAIRAVSTLQTYETVLSGTWLCRAVGPLTAEPGKQTRFFFLSRTGSASSPHVLFRLGLEKSQRYLAGRGAR